MTPLSPTFILLAAIHPELPHTFIRGSMGVSPTISDDPVDDVADLLGDREKAIEVVRMIPEHLKAESCPCQFVVDSGLDIFDITSAMEELSGQIEEAQVARATWEAENVE